MLRVVLPPLHVAGETEHAIRNQPGDYRGGVADIARDMRVNGWRVRSLHLGSPTPRVAYGALLAGGVMVVMARRAARHSGSRVERCRRGVTRDA